MTKKDAYKEMKKDFDKGKRTWSFNEIADVMERTMNIPKDKTHKILNNLGKEQKRVREELE